MKNSCNIIRTLLVILFCAVMVQSAAGRGRTVFDKNTGFKISQNKLVDGRRNLHAEIDFKLLNYANASATATLRVEDLNGNLLSTTEGKASKSRALNLKNNNNASFSMKFDMPNRLFLTNSRIGKKLRVKFILKIDGKVVINVYKEFTAGNTGSGGGNSPKSDKDKKPKSTPRKHDHDRYTSENSQWEESCPICNGTGVCNICWGAGQYYSPAAQMMWPCSACYSSGKCRMCQGRGKNVYRVYTVNGIRYMQVNSDAPRVLGSGDDGHRCGACSGLGRCAVCQGSGYGVSYTGPAPICSACNGTGRCSKCGGSGWR